MARWILRIYAGALWSLPPSFRREWGDAMLDEAEAMLHEAGPVARVTRVPWALLTDGLATLFREWSSQARQGRTNRGDGTMRGWARDARFALRSFAKTPLFTVLVVGTLGLGIGANTAIFSVVNAVILRPLPYDEPEELVAVWPGKLFSLSLLDATREGVTAFEGVSLYSGAVLTLSTDEGPTELFGGEITANHFGLMGVRPALGRDFGPDDAAPGANPVTLLSHELWSERFGADPEIVGRTIDLQHEDQPRRTVVGVMPAGYRDLLGGAEAWVPVVEDRSGSNYSSSSFAEAAARLRDDATLDRSRAEVSGVARAVREADPGMYSEAEIRGATVWPLADKLAGSLRRSLIALMGAVGLVLLIASVNVANLLLVRASGRMREVGIRAALGAGRGRLLRQFTIESLALGSAGALAGIGVAWLSRDILLGALPNGFRIDESRLDATVLGFTAVVAIGSSLVFGIVPALRASRVAPARTLSGGRGVDSTRRDLRLQHVLVSSEIALALIAVFSAGLLVASVRDLTRVDPGFDASSVLTFRLTAAPDAYPSDDDVLQYFRDVNTALRDAPGVVSVGSVGRIPMGGGTSRISFYPEGFTPDESGELPEATHRLVTAGYAETMGLRLVEGRFPTEQEFREGEPQGYVTRGLAERFFPDGALGKRFLGPGGVPWLTIAGVVDDVREDALDGPVLPTIYIPHRDWAWRTMFITVRTAGDPMATLPAIEAAVWSVSGAVPLSRVRTMSDVVARSLEEIRLLGRLFTLFGVLALVLGAVGVYGVMSYAVHRRRHEFGIRAALGAPRGRLLRGALRRGGGTLVLGLAVGALAAPGIGRLLANSIDSVQSSSWGVLAGAAAVLGVVALLAIVLPAGRAARVDPVESLRVSG